MFLQMRNPAGIRAYQKAGFKEIGRRRECRMMDGKLWDEVHMDCLSSEFESRVLRRIYAPNSE
jgi:diamine N-acetyltransferase